MTVSLPEASDSQQQSRRRTDRTVDALAGWGLFLDVLDILYCVIISGLIIQIVILIPLGHVLDCFPLLLLLVLGLHPLLQLVGHLLLILAVCPRDDVELGVVAVPNVLRPHVPIHLLVLIVVPQLISPLRFFVLVGDRVIA